MVDVANAAASDSAMIALLPTTTGWCRIKLPHMTLVYAGLIDDLKSTDFNELSKDAASIAGSFKKMTLKVSGVYLFGSDNQKVDALRLQPSPELRTMRRSVAKWNASDFPFNPHCTIGQSGPVNKNVPSTLTFDRVMVGWGDQSLEFKFKG